MPVTRILPIAKRTPSNIRQLSCLHRSTSNSSSQQCSRSHTRLVLCLRSQKWPATLLQPLCSTRTYTTAEPKQPLKYTYHVSASFVSKQSNFNPEENIFHFDPSKQVQHTTHAVRNHPNAGQDAFFISAVNSSGAVALGVADGVGGYIEAGFDSAHFSRALVARMANAASNAPDENISAQSLVVTAYYQILNEERIRGGGSTTCVGVARTDGRLNCANLGDSGFLILREGRVHYSAPPQTHGFNTPFQLAAFPKRVLLQALKYGGGPLCDQPEDAFVTSHTLRNGDVLIFATDGLFDNVSNQEVLRIVSDEMINRSGWIIGREGFMPSPKLAGDMRIQAALSKAIVARAKSASQNAKIDGPFAKEVQRLFPGENFRGGKVDDICVICAVVTAAK